MGEVVICGYARSAFTPAKKGELSLTRPDDLGAQVVKGLIKNTGIKEEEVPTPSNTCSFVVECVCGRF